MRVNLFRREAFGEDLYNSNMDDYTRVPVVSKGIFVFFVVLVISILFFLAITYKFEFVFIAYGKVEDNALTLILFDEEYKKISDKSELLIEDNVYKIDVQNIKKVKEIDAKSLFMIDNVMDIKDRFKDEKICYVKLNDSVDLPNNLYEVSVVVDRKSIMDLFLNGNEK